MYVLINDDSDEVVDDWLSFVYEDHSTLFKFKDFSFFYLICLSAGRRSLLDKVSSIMQWKDLPWSTRLAGGLVAIFSTQMDAHTIAPLLTFKNINGKFGIVKPGQPWQTHIWPLIFIISLIKTSDDTGNTGKSAFFGIKKNIYIEFVFFLYILEPWWFLLLI